MMKKMLMVAAGLVLSTGGRIAGGHTRHGTGARRLPEPADEPAQ
jgi:hypothetical protein